MSEREDTNNTRLKAHAVNVAIHVVALSILATPAAAAFSASTVPGSVAVGTVTLIVMMFVGLPAGIRLANWHDDLVEDLERLKPAHEFDEDIKYWERGDRFNYKDGDGSTKNGRFIAFTDDGACVVSVRGTLKELYIQDLATYKNRDYKDRMRENEQRALRAKAENSAYDDMLKRQREFERETQRALTDILNGDEHAGARNGDEEPAEEASSEEAAPGIDESSYVNEPEHPEPPRPRYHAT